MKKRKDGLYCAQIYLGTKPVFNEDGTPTLDKDGNPKTKRVYKTLYHKKQSELKKLVAEFMQKSERGIDISASDEPFEKWAERFIKNKQNEGVGASHLANLNTFSRHLCPVHKKSLQKITTENLQAIIDILSKYHDGKKPLSKRTLAGIVQFASQVYKMAIGARVVDYNPASYVKVPKNASVTHRTAITEEQQRWIVDTPHRAQTAAMLMLYSGLRRGEATALTWADIDLENSQITVNKAVYYENNKAVVKGPKTEAGKRVVDIPRQLVDYLQSVPKDCFYILHMKNGEMLSQNAWKSLWKSYMGELNRKYGGGEKENKHAPKKLPIKINTFTPHQLRHTFCTLLYFAGYSVVETKYQMGHSSIKTTIDIYTHLDKANKRESKGKLTKYLCQYDASNANKKESF